MTRFIRSATPFLCAALAACAARVDPTGPQVLRASNVFAYSGAGGPLPVAAYVIFPDQARVRLPGVKTEWGYWDWLFIEGVGSVFREKHRVQGEQEVPARNDVVLVKPELWGTFQYENDCWLHVKFRLLDRSSGLLGTVNAEARSTGTSARINCADQVIDQFQREVTTTLRDKLVARSGG
ncbi:MAG: hypothetical protein ACRENP_01315 [Longimicrobiales bacterium]